MLKYRTKEERKREYINDVQVYGGVMLSRIALYFPID